MPSDVFPRIRFGVREGDRDKEDRLADRGVEGGINQEMSNFIFLRNCGKYLFISSLNLNNCHNFVSIYEFSCKKKYRHDDKVGEDRERWWVGGGQMLFQRMMYVTAGTFLAEFPRLKFYLVHYAFYSCAPE